uniref:AB hydrolase-1 domain-containing protein n=1 Tax=Acrobeloides nanus TaxID=290746 RepID=A0A914DR76_9BILA
MCKETSVVDHQNSSNLDEIDSDVVLGEELDDDEPLQSEILCRLKEAEKKLFSRVKTPYKTYYVKIPLWDSKIYTLTIKADDADESAIPIVLLHGFGGGIALWSVVLDGLVSSKRVVHAFDLLGFGSSSRPKFSTEAIIAEKEFVRSIEEWRNAMNIDQMIFVGHSFGGFLGCSYIMEYPDRVRHLVLVDPWGMDENKPTDGDQVRRVPWWAIALRPIISKFNPMATARLLGSRAPKVMKRFRPEMEGWYKTDAIYDYNYLNNAQKPSGEIAFKNMCILLAQVKRPIIHRVHSMHYKVPITFMHGCDSWVDSTPAYSIKYMREKSYVHVKLIKNAGHQIFAEAPLHFLKAMEDIVEIINRNRDLIDTKNSKNLENL